MCTIYVVTSHFFRRILRCLLLLSLVYPLSGEYDVIYLVYQNPMLYKRVWSKEERRKDVECAKRGENVIMTAYDRR
jgi:hypothetical protein